MAKTSAVVDSIQRELAALGNPKDATFLQGFFKTGPGQYGEGDRFRGIRVPVTRTVARKYAAIPLEDVQTLLQSPWHEDRLLALLILVRRYAKGDPDTRDRVYRLYFDQIDRVNNWDLVDTSAPHIVGAHLHGSDGSVLTELAQSANLWRRRIAIIATAHYIQKGEFDETLRIAEILLHDPEDLIHKAVGWMLREIGKRDQAVEEAFLARHCRTMPRTMLRYAIERFPQPLRQSYLRPPNP